MTRVEMSWFRVGDLMMNLEKSLSRVTEVSWFSVCFLPRLAWLIRGQRSIMTSQPSHFRIPKRQSSHAPIPKRWTPNPTNPTAGIGRQRAGKDLLRRGTHAKLCSRVEGHQPISAKIVSIFSQSAESAEFEANKSQHWDRRSNRHWNKQHRQPCLFVLTIRGVFFFL